jgi:hypothetical protein
MFNIDSATHLTNSLKLGMNIVEVVFGKEPGGRASGECYIRFETKGDAERASRLSGQYLGKR